MKYPGNRGDNDLIENWSIINQAATSPQGMFCSGSEGLKKLI